MATFCTRHTQQQQQQQYRYVGRRGGLGCLVEKNTKCSASARLFAARLKSQSAQAWMLESRVERSTLGARPSSSSRRRLGFSMSENLAELLKNPTGKQTNGTGTISASVSHKKPVSICRNKRDLFWRPDQNKKLGIGFAE